MKIDAISRNAPHTTATTRRGLVIGAGVAGAAAVAARALIPGEPAVAAATAGAAGTQSAMAADSAGYQLTPHVLRYYETARS